jgi:hypothetical protein
MIILLIQNDDGVAFICFFNHSIIFIKFFLIWMSSFISFLVSVLLVCLNVCKDVLCFWQHCISLDLVL